MPTLADGSTDMSRLSTNLFQIDARLIAVAVDPGSKANFAGDVLERASFAELQRELQEVAPEEHVTSLLWPSEGSVGDKLQYVLTIPLNLVFSLTMRHDPLQWYITLPAAMFWLALLAYLLDMAAGTVGCAMGIDDQLVGETVVAAGTSMPNVLAAVLAGNRGQVDTAASQAFGSNNFDILIAFALPYFVKALISGGPVQIDVGSAQRDGLINLGVLAVYILVLMFSRWRLTKAVGWFFIILYVLNVAYLCIFINK